MLRQCAHPRLGARLHSASHFEQMVGVFGRAIIRSAGPESSRFARSRSYFKNSRQPFHASGFHKFNTRASTQPVAPPRPTGARAPTHAATRCGGALRSIQPRRKAGTPPGARLRMSSAWSRRVFRGDPPRAESRSARANSAQRPRSGEGFALRRARRIPAHAASICASLLPPSPITQSSISQRRQCGFHGADRGGTGADGCGSRAIAAVSAREIAVVSNTTR